MTKTKPGENQFNLQKMMGISNKRMNILEKEYKKSVTTTDYVSESITMLLDKCETKEEAFMMAFNLGGRYERINSPMADLMRLLGGKR